MLKELETILGNDQITYENLQKLHYCDAIIKEGKILLSSFSFYEILKYLLWFYH